MNNDRELLELAARAVGYHLSWSERFDCGEIWKDGDKLKRFWQPHRDNGDALWLRNRLQAQLVDEGDCIFVGIYQYGIDSVEIREEYVRDADGGFASSESVDYATRIAIVLAAADIQRKKEAA